jgi:multidrug efflux pump subunit AcrA (membrane-fusion protein)
MDRRRTQIWLAAAAVFIFAIAGWFWVRFRPQVQTAAVVVLDLRGRATVRGESPPETVPLLVVPRNAKTLHLELPIGSNEGAYDLALLDQSGAEVFRTSAMAKLEDHIVVLTSDVDLAGVSPGSYFLGLRQRDLEWTRFRIRLL